MSITKAKKGKGLWYHPSVKPPDKLLLCKVAIHPDGSSYFAVWNFSHWNTFSAYEGAALQMEAKLSMSFYYQVVRELEFKDNTGRPPGTGWYRVHKNHPFMSKTHRYWAYWNGQHWSQAKMFKDRRNLVFSPVNVFVWMSR